MRDNLSRSQVNSEISKVELELKELDLRLKRLWDRIKTRPSLWKQTQYNKGVFWVIAIMGYRCMYFNYIEYGWGWGEYSNW